MFERAVVESFAEPPEFFDLVLFEEFAKRLVCLENQTRFRSGKSASSKKSDLLKRYAPSRSS